MGHTRGEEAESQRKRRITKRKTAELPQDVVTEILLRLPVKSIVRFWCVCKLWYDLSGGHNFIDTYRNRNYIPEKNGSFYYLSLCAPYDTMISFQFCHGQVNLTLPYKVKKVKIVGCFNGLVCLSICLMHEDFILWNPATKKFRRIRPLTTREYSSTSQTISCGFCFDHVNNTYKVVRIAFRPCLWREDKEKDTIVDINIFRSKNNTWAGKEIYMGCCDRTEVTCVRTCMYWLVSGDHTKFIRCFDMVDELFKKIALPPCHGCSCPCLQLSSGYRESLALIVRRNSDSSSFFDVWVLNDCGGSNQSWSKQLTFWPSVYSAFPEGFFTKEGVDFVLLRTKDGDFHLCDLHTSETKTLSMMTNEIADGLFLYKESLASVV